MGSQNIRVDFSKAGLWSFNPSELLKRPPFTTSPIIALLIFLGDLILCPGKSRVELCTQMVDEYATVTASVLSTDKTGMPSHRLQRWN